jgi:hypothetical protein
MAAGGVPAFDAGHPDDECHEEAECGDDSKPFCNTGHCVECRGSADCTSGGRPICVGDHCAECGVDSDCTDPGKPGCLGATGRCEDCSRDAHCSPGEYCNLGEGKCR